MSDDSILDAGSFRFSTTDLNVTLDQVQADLADLHHVDAALAHLTELTGGNIYWPPLQRGASVDVTLGSKHPFTVTAEWADYRNWRSPLSWIPAGPAGGRRHLEEDLAEIAEESRSWASTEMSYVRDVLVKRYSVPESLDAYDWLDSDLALVKRRIETAIDDNFGDLRKLSNWEGTAATSFQNNFYDRFDTVRKHQYELAEALRAAVQTSKALAHATQYSLMNILTAVSKALDEQLKLRSEGSYGDQPSTKETLALTGAGGTVIAALSVRIAPLANAAGVVSGSAWLGSEVLPPVEADGATGRVTIEASSADQMLTALVDTIRELDRSVDNEYASFREELHKLQDDMRGKPLYPKRPELANGVDADGSVELIDPDLFYHKSGSRI